jgi:hypothetical protein
VISSLLTKIADKGLQQYSKDDRTNVWNYINRGGHDFNLLIAGSSRAKKHFKPNVISQETGKTCFNLGIDGAKMFIQLAIFHTYLAHNTAPRILVLNVESGTFGMDSILFNKEQFLPFYSSKITDHYLSKVIPTSEKILPLFKYHGYSDLFFQGLLNFARNNREIRTPSDSGFEGLPVSAVFAEMPKEMIDHLHTNDLKAGMKVLCDFEKLCIKKNCQLVLVLSPSQAVESEKFQNSLLKFSRDHQVPFLNYSQNQDLKEDSLYYDTQHLNKNGAIIFSQIFAHDLAEIINK